MRSSVVVLWVVIRHKNDAPWVGCQPMRSAGWRNVEWCRNSALPGAAVLSNSAARSESLSTMRPPPPGIQAVRAAGGTRGQSGDLMGWAPLIEVSYRKKMSSNWRIAFRPHKDTSGERTGFFSTFRWMCTMARLPYDALDSPHLSAMMQCRRLCDGMD